MKRALRTGGLLITVLLTFGLAQETQQQQEQQMQQMQQSGQTTQEQRLQDVRLSAVLMELRQIQAKLGQIINEVEFQVTARELGTAVTNLERGARASTLRAARSDLRNLRTDIEAGVNPEETAREIRWISYILNRAFAGVTGEERQLIMEFQEQLHTLEEQVRTGAADTQTTFEGALTQLDEVIERGQHEFDLER